MANNTLIASIPELEPCPPVVSDPTAQLGTYAGEADWNVALGRLTALRREKKWQWFGAFDANWAIGGAVVRTGYAGKSFVWLFNRAQRRMFVDHAVTVPRSLVGVADAPQGPRVAHLKGLKNAWSIRRTEQQWLIGGKMGELSFDLSLTSVLTPFTAVCPIPGGFNVTRKNVGLEARGKIQAPGIEGIALENAVGFLDHSHGVLERTTSWRWAIGAGSLDDGTPIGFNLIEGFNDNRENVVWLGSSLYKVPPATFDRTRSAWRITTSDDTVDLTLNPEGSRDEDMNLGVVSSRYVQPLGTWSGRLIGNEVVGLVGVAEDHTAKW